MTKKILLTTLMLGIMSPLLSAQSGEAVYKKACQTCHAAGVAGAPKKGDSAAWKARLAKGMPALVKSIKAGKNAMPPGGMCTDCSDADYKAAIKYMSSSKK